MKTDPVLEIALNLFAQLMDNENIPLEERGRLLIEQRRMLEALRRD